MNESWAIANKNGKLNGLHDEQYVNNAAKMCDAVFPDNAPHRVVRVVAVDEILATLKDPANVHAMMLRGVIAPIGWRLTCHLTGEVPNGEDVQLAEIVRLREEVEALHKALDERESDMHARIRAGYDRTVDDSWRAHCAKLQAEIEALRADAKRWKWRKENPWARIESSARFWRVEGSPLGWHPSIDAAVDAAIASALEPKS